MIFEDDDEGGSERAAAVANDVVKVTLPLGAPAAAFLAYAEDHLTKVAGSTRLPVAEEEVELGWETGAALEVATVVEEDALAA